MASLSDKLRRERELRGISLKQISEDTKIGVRFLEALEEGSIERIPGEFYRRSYLRAYARYLGLDEERALNAYTYSRHESDNGASSDDPVGRENPWIKWGVAAVVIAVPAILLLRPETREAATSPEITSVPEAPSPPLGVTRERDEALTPARVEAQPATSVPLAEPLARRSDALRIELFIDEACWLEVIADGEVVVSGLKEVGFRSEFTGSEVRLWLGNAGGVRIRVNGRPARSFGRSGQVMKDVLITNTNYADFLSREGERS